MCRQNIQTKTL